MRPGGRTVCRLAVLLAVTLSAACEQPAPVQKAVERDLPSARLGRAGPYLVVVPAPRQGGPSTSTSGKPDGTFAVTSAGDGTSVTAP